MVEFRTPRKAVSHFWRSKDSVGALPSHIRDQPNYKLVHGNDLGTRVAVKSLGGIQVEHRSLKSQGGLGDVVCFGKQTTSFLFASNRRKRVRC